MNNQDQPKIINKKKRNYVQRMVFPVKFIEVTLICFLQMKNSIFKENNFLNINKG